MAAGGCVRAVRAPGGAALSRAQIDGLTELAKEHGAKGMAYVYVEEGRSLRGPIVKFLGEAEQQLVVERTQAQPGDLVVFAADQAPAAAEVLGALRLALIALLKLQPAAPLGAGLGRRVPAVRDRQGDGPPHLRP